jgi:sugar/nucleoside kinase (ribokinase family)
MKPQFSRAQASSLLETLTPGKLIETRGMRIDLGGSCSNTGRGFKLFGVSGKIICCLGDDRLGKISKELLEEMGLETSVLPSTSSTSHSVVIEVPGYDRIFLHDPGANRDFDGRAIAKEDLAGFKHFHFGYPPMMPKMYENCGKALAEMLKTAKSAGLSTSVDMAFIDPQSEAAKADWKAVLSNALPYVDYFVPSFEEIAGILDPDGLSGLLESAGGGDAIAAMDVERDAAPLARELLELGASNVLIKCGAKGMIFKSRGEEIFSPPFKPCRILSATGAGDVSIAAFLASALLGCKTSKCLDLACAAGAALVEGSLEGMGGLDGLRQRIAAGWQRL